MKQIQIKRRKRVRQTENPDPPVIVSKKRAKNPLFREADQS